ncbi:hypothetical protein M2332_001986 [Sphingobium sp. B11D3A]|nr:hypothetical protein [Sphingobium sp. B11D3A]
MDGIGMRCPHGDDHAPDAAGMRAATGKSGAMEQFNAGALMQAELTQAATVHLGYGVPVDTVDIGWAIGF